MVRSLSFSILLMMLILLFRTADVTSSELITCEFRTGQAPSITLTCFFPEDTDVTRSHLTVYLKKESNTVPISVVDCIRADEKKDADCEVEPGYYYDKVMYSNHTSIQLINASDTHLGTYYCQLMYSGLGFEKCELTAQHLAKLHDARTTRSSEGSTRLTTETVSSLSDATTTKDPVQGTRDQESTVTYPDGDTKSERGNQERSRVHALTIVLIIIAAVLIIIAAVLITITICKKGSQWLPCTRKKTPQRIENNNADEPETERLINKSANPDGPTENGENVGSPQCDLHSHPEKDDHVLDIEDIPPAPERLQGQENPNGVPATVYSSDNVDGLGKTVEAGSPPKNAACSRTESDGRIYTNIGTSGTYVLYMSDSPRSKDTEGKAGLAVNHPQNETGEGATASHSENVSTPLKSHGSITTEEQARSTNDNIQKTRSANADTNVHKTTEETISAPKCQNENQGKVSGKGVEDPSLETFLKVLDRVTAKENHRNCLIRIVNMCAKIMGTTQMDLYYFWIEHVLRKGSGSVIRQDGIEIKKKTVQTTKPGGVEEKKEVLKAKVAWEKNSNQDMSLSDMKLRVLPETTDIKKTDERKSVGDEGDTTMERNGVCERDCDVTKSCKTNREAASPENMYGSGWSSTDKRGIPVQEESHTSSTSSELATGFEKQRGNPTDNRSSSSQNNQNLSATSYSAEPSGKTNAQQDTNSGGANVSLASKNAQLSEEEEESETLSFPPTAGSKLKVRRF